MLPARLLDMRSTLGVDRFLGQVDVGGMPRQKCTTGFGDSARLCVAPAVEHGLKD